MHKVCKTCAIDKPLSSYGKHKTMSDGLRKSCKDCRTVERKEYRNKYKLDICEYNKRYYITNKDTIKIKRRLYEHERYYNDIQFYLHSCLSSRLRSGLKYKSKTTVSYIGCSYEFITNYLHSLFEEGMTWENRGSLWEIDHIIPVSAWDMANELEVLCCWNYRNLQPLWKSINRSKSNQYSIEDKLLFMKELTPQLEPCQIDR